MDRFSVGQHTTYMCFKIFAYTFDRCCVHRTRNPSQSVPVCVFKVKLAYTIRSPHRVVKPRRRGGFIGVQHTAATAAGSGRPWRKWKVFRLICAYSALILIRRGHRLIGHWGYHSSSHGMEVVLELSELGNHGFSRQSGLIVGAPGD